MEIEKIEEYILLAKQILADKEYKEKLEKDVNELKRDLAEQKQIINNLMLNNSRWYDFIEKQKRQESCPHSWHDIAPNTKRCSYCEKEATAIFIPK